jgi:hypothetical protein
VRRPPIPINTYYERVGIMRAFRVGRTARIIGITHALGAKNACSWATLREILRSTIVVLSLVPQSCLRKSHQVRHHNLEADAHLRGGRSPNERAGARRLQALSIKSRHFRPTEGTLAIIEGR